MLLVGANLVMCLRAGRQKETKYNRALFGENAPKTGQIW